MKTIEIIKNQASKMTKTYWIDAGLFLWLIVAFFVLAFKFMHLLSDYL